MATYQDNFFTRGPSPLARVVFFGLIAMGVMIADHRFDALGAVRVAVATVLNPVERTLMMPGEALRSGTDYFATQERLVAENRLLTQQVLHLTANGQRAELLAAEQSQVKALVDAQNRFARDGVIAEIIRDARNPFQRKIVLNRGAADGVKPGAAVIDGSGVVGQVTAIGSHSAEVTLTTEKEQSVPVIVLRPVLATAIPIAVPAPTTAIADAKPEVAGPEPKTESKPAATSEANEPTPTPARVSGLRAVAVGSGREGTIELPFIPVAADIQVGDRLVTSGIDGTYPAGLFVGTVTVVDKNPAFSFARIIALPATAPDHHRFVKVLAVPEGKHAYPRMDSGVGSDKTSSEKVTGKAARRDQRVESRRATRDGREGR